MLDTFSVESRVQQNMGPTEANNIPSRIQKQELFSESSSKYYLLWQNNENSREKDHYAPKENVISDDGPQDGQGLILPTQTPA